MTAYVFTFLRYIDGDSLYSRLCISGYRLQVIHTSLYRFPYNFVRTRSKGSFFARAIESMVISMFWLQAGRLLRWPAPEEMDHTQAIGKSAVFWLSTSATESIHCKKWLLQKR
jgi:hypothetical protein